MEQGYETLKIYFCSLFTLIKKCVYLQHTFYKLKVLKMAYRFKNNYYISTTCECGATRKVKDHGNWVGYYCPTCKQGGSVQKKERKHFSKHSRGWAHTLPQSNRNSNPSGLSEWSRPSSLSEAMGDDAPISLYEHCRQESGGLEGQDLDYVNRHYGHN